MDNNYIDSFITFSNNTNEIFANILSIINSQQQLYGNIINTNNIASTNRTTSSNISRNIIQQTLLRNLIMRIPSNNNLSSTSNQIPSREQIQRETNRIQFGEIQNPINTSCPITHVDFNENDYVLQINHCGHIFSENSLMEWFNRNNCCPLCRYSISENNNSSNNADNETGNTNDSFSQNNDSTTTGNLENNNTSNSLNSSNNINNNINNLLNQTRRLNISPFINRNNINNSSNPNGATTINNDLLFQLQNIIDTFNNEIEFEVALITPAD